MSSALIRQDLGPMIVGYVLVMGALAVGLRILRRPRSPEGGEAGTPAERREPPRAAGPRKRRFLAAAGKVPAGWPRLAGHVLATAVGGYLVLMAIIIFYFYGVAPVAGNFVQSAFSGCAMLIALSLPVFAALSWLAERKGWRI